MAAVFTAVNGCSPTDSSQTDEEKEPHFVLGNSRFNEMNFDGAIEAFEESLEVNPHSAQAHYRLAQIFDAKEPDPAAAIYHYQEYLKLSAGAKNRDVIQQRIDSCKQQLATDVLQLPSAPAVQKQLDTLVDQNRKLQTQVDQLNGVIKQWNVYYASVQAAQRTGQNSSSPTGDSNAQPPTTSLTPDDISSAPPSSTTVQQPAPVRNTTSRPIASKPHTHIVASGETLASIARKCSVSLTALQTANPGVNPKKMRVGQSLNLP